MKLFFTFTCILFLNISLSAQDYYAQYKHYALYHDSLENVTFLLDTISKKSTKIDFRYSNSRAHNFREGFVYVRTGDMKGLVNLEGKRLLDPSHYIRFNKEDSLINAYICEEQSWIFLNYEGDTVSMGKALNHRYSPTLNSFLNPAYTKDAETKLPQWGYLDKKGNWAIEPIFFEAEPFIFGYAKVNYLGYWGLINSKGEFIIPAVYLTSKLQDISDN